MNVPGSYSKQTNPSKNGSFDFLTEQDGIGRYFNIVSSQQLIDTVLDSGKVPKSLAEANAPLSAASDVIKRTILDVTRGALPSTQLAETLADKVGSDKKDFVKIMQFNGPVGTKQLQLGSAESIDEILGIDTSQTSTSTLSSIMLFAQGLSPAVRNSGGLTLFFNGVPSIELARAVPYLEVNVQVAQKAVTEDDRLHGPGLMKFIMGAAKVTDRNLQLASVARQILQPDGTYEYKEDSEYSTFGMEAFLMPQTMVPYGEGGYAEMNSPTLRSTPILDPFRPVGSIQSFSVKVVNSTGIGSYKNASLVMLVHDRSRLHELAYFIKPDLYSRTNLMIEYGWIHPDVDATKNPWGALINMMRCREKYGVTNTSFSMDDTGQVTVTLDLHMLGGIQWGTTKVTDNDSAFSTSTKNLDGIKTKLSELLDEKASKFKGGKLPTKGVFANQIFQSALKTQGAIDISKVNKLVNSALKGLGNSNDLNKEIKGVLQDYRGEIKTFVKALGNEIEKKWDKIDGKSSEVKSKDKKPEYTSSLLDPYLDTKIQAVNNAPGAVTAFEGKPGGDNIVSFGKLFMSFVAQPMSSTGKFDDIQVIFYQSNLNAGAFRNKNLASFPIKLADAKKYYEKVAKEKRTPHLTVAEFCSLMTQYFFDNMSAVPYGLNDFYTFDEKDGRSVQRKKVGKTRDPDRINDKIEKALKDMGISTFRPIQLDVMMETLASATPQGSEGVPKEGFENTNILRIHVFDKAATAYQTASEILNASKSEELSIITFDDEEGNAVTADATKQIIEDAVKNEILERISESEDKIYKNKYIIKGGHDEVKQFVMSTVPHMIYGSQNSIIESLGLSSQQMPELSTINILRAPSAGSITPEGSGQGGVPLRTTPVQMTINMLGCPIISYAQQFFVDVGTGTDIDNIYAVTELNHTLEPGAFKTSMGMTPLHAYAKFESAINKLEKQLAALEKADSTASPSTPTG